MLKVSIGVNDIGISNNFTTLSMDLTSSSNGTVTLDDIDKYINELENRTGLSVTDFTDEFLKSSLWPSFQQHNWHEQAERVIQKPAYIVMLILCLFALITNILSIIAVYHVQHSLTMHLKLIINLSVSDIFIVISVLVHILNKIFNNPGQIGITERNSRLLNACFLSTVIAFNTMSFLITLLNLLAMAIDHYIAIMHPFRYPYIWSRRKGSIFIVGLWCLAGMGGLSNFMSDINKYNQQTLFNYCEFVMYDSFHGEYLISAVTLICMFSIIFIYTRIFYEVRKLQKKMPSIPNFPLHTSKAMITTLVIIGTFILCWLPNCIFQITMVIEMHFNKTFIYKLFHTFIQISKYLYILQLANCLLDPIIYAVRLKVVKKGYKNCLKRLSTKYKLWFLDNTSNYNRENRKKMSKMYDFEFTAMNNESQNISVTLKSEESDINDNELVPMVTVHASIHTENILEDDSSALTDNTQMCETSFIVDDSDKVNIVQDGESDVK